MGLLWVPLAPTRCRGCILISAFQVPVSHYDVQCHRHRGNSKEPDRYRTRGHPAPPRQPHEVTFVAYDYNGIDAGLWYNRTAYIIPAPRCKHEVIMPWSAVRLGKIHECEVHLFGFPEL